eukprot:scaffold14647_cov60-Phaeocystis_antarctica.AAC.9
MAVAVPPLAAITVFVAVTVANITTLPLRVLALDSAKLRHHATGELHVRHRAAAPPAATKRLSRGRLGLEELQNRVVVGRVLLLHSQYGTARCHERGDERVVRHDVIDLPRGDGGGDGGRDVRRGLNFSKFSADGARYSHQCSTSASAGSLPPTKSSSHAERGTTQDAIRCSPPSDSSASPPRPRPCNSQRMAAARPRHACSSATSKTRSLTRETAQRPCRSPSRSSAPIAGRTRSWGNWIRSPLPRTPRRPTASPRSAPTPR